MDPLTKVQGSEETEQEGAPPNSPALGAEGEPCPACGSPLAADQRYCLNCGRRRAGSRVPYAALLSGRAPEDLLAAASTTPPPPPPRERRALPVGLAALGAGAVILTLALGVLLGAATSESEPPRLVAAPAPAPQAPPVVNVTTGAPTEATEEAFVSDWPGDDGFTVQLETLDKASSQVSDVDQAKTDAEAAGASEVGVLDSDEWPTLDPGNYVVYSGVFTGKSAKADARKALKGLRKDFPAAKVVEVSAGGGAVAAGAKGTKPEEKVQEVDKSALEDLQNSTGAEQQKKSANLPPTLGTGGEPPPADNQEAGGGTEAQVIE